MDLEFPRVCVQVHAALFVGMLTVVRVRNRFKVFNSSRYTFPPAAVIAVTFWARIVTDINPALAHLLFR